MTAVLSRPAPAARAATLRAHAGAEARRYARSPVFLAGVVLLVWGTVTAFGDLAVENGGMAIYPAFCLGVCGVLVGRWTRFPGAGLLAAVVLTGWTLACTLGLLMEASRWGTLVHLNAPFATWTSADGPDAAPWLAGGSPWWYVAYQVALCGLAATAAMGHEATGARRARLWRALAVLAVLAVGCLALAAAADPTRVPL